MKTYNFTIDNNINKNFNHNSFLYDTDYSKILDALIADNVIKSNNYLTGNIVEHDLGKKNIFTKLFTKKKSSELDDFVKAAKYLTNYKTKKNAPTNLPFKLGKIYHLIDGTPIIFYSDEIQIGFDLYSYDEFENINFLNTLDNKTKNAIIEIYANGLKIEIHC